jgi:hypothetical protein
VEGAIRKEHTGEEASTSGEKGGGALAEDERPALTPILQGSAAYVPGSSGCLVARGGWRSLPRPGPGDMEARKKVDHIEGCCASESRTSETVSLMLGVNRSSAFAAFGSLKAIRRWIGPCGDKLST